MKVLILNLLFCGGKPSNLKPTREIDPDTEGYITERVAELRGKLTSGYKTSGNFGYAEVDIDGLDQTEFYARSSINTLSKAHEERVPDISLWPEDPAFEATYAADRTGRVSLRRNDTEYRILNDIDAKLNGNTNASGKIKLFTEQPPCESCSRVIQEFAEKYPNIEIEVIYNTDGMRVPTKKGN